MFPDASCNFNARHKRHPVINDGNVWLFIKRPGDCLLAIARLEGKWKLSQNKGVADVAGIRDGLAAATSQPARPCNTARSPDRTAS